MTPDWVSNLNLDWAASFACFIGAVSFFTVHVISSPRKQHWMVLPTWVRLPFFIAGAALLYRTADLFSLALQFPEGRGHVTPVGLIALTTFSWALAAMAVHAVSMAYNPRVWSTLRWIHSKAVCPERRPRAALNRVLKDVAVEELRDAGVIVAGPREPWPLET